MRWFCLAAEGTAATGYMCVRFPPSVLAKHDNIDISKVQSAILKITQRPFWAAALLRRTSVFAESENLGAGMALPFRAFKFQRVEDASGGRNPKRKT